MTSKHLADLLTATTPDAAPTDSAQGTISGTANAGSPAQQDATTTPTGKATGRPEARSCLLGPSGSKSTIQLNCPDGAHVVGHAKAIVHSDVEVIVYDEGKALLATFAEDHPDWAFPRMASVNFALASACLWASSRASRAATAWLARGQPAASTHPDHPLGRSGLWLGYDESGEPTRSSGEFLDTSVRETW